MDARIGEPDIEILHLYGSGLTSDIHLSISGTDSTQFSVIPQIIFHPESGILPATVVSIIYKPDELGSHSGTLNIRSAGADDLILSLSGSVISTGMDPISKKVSLLTEPGRLIIRGASSYAVYNIQGVLVAQSRKSSERSSVNLDPGIYLVKIGNSVEKVVVY
jgi:hypothetical protein